MQCVTDPTSPIPVTQVTELQKHLEQERQLRRVTARMLKETQEAVSTTAAAQEAQQKVLAEAAAMQQEQAQAIERQRQEVETLLAQQSEHQVRTKKVMRDSVKTQGG